MADEIDGYIITISAEIDPKDLKKIRDKLTKLQDDAKKNALKLGLNTKEGPAGNANMKSPLGDGKYSSEILNILKSSNKTLLDISSTLKLSDNKVSRLTAQEKEDKKKEKDERKKAADDKKKATEDRKLANSKNPKKPLPEIKNPNIPGMMLGPAGVSAAGAAGVVGAAAAGILVLIKGLLDRATGFVDAKITEDLKLDQFGMILGRSKKEIYQLGVQANLAGTSIDSLVRTQQDFMKELLSGQIDPVKAGVLAQAGINIKDLILNANGDPQKFMQTYFKTLHKALQKQPAFVRSAEEEYMGFSVEEQYARTKGGLFGKENTQRARGITSKVNKFPTADESRQQRLSFVGGLQEKAAEVRNRAEAYLPEAIGNLKIDTGLVQIETATVNIINKGLSGNLPGNIRKESQSKIENQIGSYEWMKKNFTNHQNLHDSATTNASSNH